MSEDTGFRDIFGVPLAVGDRVLMVQMQRLGRDKGLKLAVIAALYHSERERDAPTLRLVPISYEPSGGRVEVGRMVSVRAHSTPVYRMNEQALSALPEPLLRGMEEAMTVVG